MKKSALRKLIREEIKKLNEYFVREGDSFDSILVLNLFSDMLAGQKLSDYEEEWKTDGEWKAIENEYIPQADTF